VTLRLPRRMSGTHVRSSAGLDVGSLGRQAATAMLARTVVMRVITAMGTVVLARILVPADFGVYAVLVLVQQVLTYFADFGVGPSLIQQGDDPTREELATAWLIQQLMWIVCAVAIWVAAPFVERLIPSLGAGFGWQLRLLSLSIAFTMLRSLPSAMLVRVLRFREVATIELFGHIAFWATAVSLALMGAGVWSFAVALTAQSAISAALANLICRYWPGLYFDRAIARRLLGFGVAYQASNVVTTLRDGVIPLCGGFAGSVASIGYLQFSLRVSQLTSSVDEIIARVSFPAFSRIKGDAKRTARVLSDSVTLVCLLIGAPQAWIIATAPNLVPVVFGDRWTPSVLALQLMCLGVLSAAPARLRAAGRRARLCRGRFCRPVAPGSSRPTRRLFPVEERDPGLLPQRSGGTGELVRRGPRRRRPRLDHLGRSIRDQLSRSAVGVRPDRPGPIVASRRRRPQPTRLGVSSAFPPTRRPRAWPRRQRGRRAE
jgi:hypothetical protein